MLRRMLLILVLVLATLGMPLPANSVGGQWPFPDKSEAYIVVSQDEQRMLIYEAGFLVRVLPVTTGWPGARPSITPVFRGFVGPYWGTFASFGALHDHGYYLFTDYLSEPWEAWNLPGSGAWNGDVLIHGAPYTFGPDGEVVYDLSGIGRYPVSHGCIRLLPEDAEWFSQWDPIGVPITILWFTE